MARNHGFSARGLLLSAIVIGGFFVSIIYSSCAPSNGPSNDQTGSFHPSGIITSGSHAPDWAGQPAFVQQALDVQGRHGTSLLAIEGVIGHGVGLDESNPNQAVILVFTNHDGVRGIPTSIEGLRTRIEMVGTITALQSSGNVHDDGKSHGGSGGGTTVSYTSKDRNPIPAGVSTGEDDICEAGTIGALVTTAGIASTPSYEATGSASDGITTYSHQYTATTPHYMLSCNHVFANENGATGATQEDQPGRYDNSCTAGNGVGALYAWNYIDASNNNYYDVALAECDPTVSNTGGSSPYWTPEMQGNWYMPSNTVVSPTVGMAVQKVGRTTGHTTGSIAGINVTIKVSYANFTATFVDQIYVKGSFIKSGDSGSMMVTNNSSNNHVGLNFAGGSNGSFANRMDHITADFGLSFPQSSF
jgi:hypothetical protein